MTTENPLHVFFRNEEERKVARLDAVRDTISKSEGPISPDLRNEIVRMFVTDAEDVLRSHPGFRLENKMNSIRTTLQLFDQAYADLSSALCEFHEFAVSPEFHFRSNRSKAKKLEACIRKEVFALSELAHSLQDHTRRLRSEWEPEGFSDTLSESFGSDGLHDFICGLRRALHHLHMVEANWTIRDSGPNATSHYLFSKKELLDVNDGWNARAQQYLTECSEDIDVKSIAESYYPRLHRFYDWLLEQSEDSPPPKVTDYRLCWNSHRVHNLQLSWNFLLKEFLKRDIDPYEYLNRYLTEEEHTQVMTLPNHSKEQVDLIIEIVDELSGVNNSIRSMVYNLFKVDAN